MKKEKQYKSSLVITITEETKDAIKAIKNLISPVPKYGTYEMLMRYFITLHNAYSANLGVDKENNALMKLDTFKRQGIQAPFIPRYKKIDTEYYPIITESNE